MTILNESGVPDVVSPLRGLPTLAERLPDTLLVVAGTRADVHLARSLAISLPGLPVSRIGQDSSLHPRVTFVVLEPDEEPPEGALASRVIEAAAGSQHTGLVLLVACRSTALLGVDASFEAELAGRRLGLPVRAIAPDDGSMGVFTTDLEDAAIRALVELSPQEGLLPEPEEARSYSKGGLLGRLPLGGRAGRRGMSKRGAQRPVVLLGALPGPREEISAELSRAGVEVSGAVPDMMSGQLPDIGEGTVVASMDPYLAGSWRAAEERGATVVRTLFPIGVDGTARFVQDAVALAGRTTSEGGRAREVWRELEPLRNRIRGKRIFFTGDTGLEVPLARFLAGAGAVVVEVGTPRLEKRFLAAELSALGEDVDVVEAPDWRAQLERIDSARPDVVVASPGLYAPLVARGHLCCSSLSLLSLGVHGYKGARRILELFARTFERAEALDALDL